MSEFASAAMMRVMLRGMRALGLQPPPLDLGQLGSSRVELAAKRALVGSALAQGGRACLPLLGQGVHRLRHEATYRAFTQAHDARGLIERWQRLERYIHSNHRVELLALMPDAAELQHRAVGGAARPLAEESLLVAGVLAALLQSIGLAGVSVWIQGTCVFPTPAPAGSPLDDETYDASRWHLRWQPPAAAPSASVPQSTSVRSAHRRAQQPAMIDLLDPEWSSTTAKTAAVISQHLLQRISIAQVAEQLCCSVRSLQRQLASDTTSFSAVLSEVRSRTAAWWLVNSNESLSAVGFLSGYADQAHFTRDFQNHVGLTPASYRGQFSA